MWNTTHEPDRQINKTCSSPDASDELLLEQFVAGHLHAADELFRRHQRAAYVVAYRILANDADARDAVQQGFTNAFTHLQHFRGQSSFRIWLLSVVSNAARTITRPQSSRRSVEREYAARHSAKELHTPHDELVAKERRELIARILRQHATVLERIVWSLHIREAMPYSEIAEVFQGMTAEKPRNVVRKLRVLLEKHLLQADSQSSE